MNINQESMVSSQSIKQAFNTAYYCLSDMAVTVLEEQLNCDPSLWDCAWREFDSFASAYLNTAWVYGCGNHSGVLDIDEETAREWFNDRTTIIEFDGGVLVNTNF